MLASIVLNVALVVGLTYRCMALTQSSRQPDPKTLDIWVVAGQSNSQGWALLKAPVPSDAHVFTLDQDGKWVVAREPLNQQFYRWTPEPVEQNIRLQRNDLTMPPGKDLDDFLKEQKRQGSSLGGVGPGLIFARQLHQATGHDIGLIMCGVGSPIREWDPDSNPPGELYSNMIALIRKSGARPKGIIWYQGESDALSPGAADHYEQALLRLIDGIRRDLRQPELPILCVQTGRFVYPYSSSSQSWETVREAQRRAALERQRVYLISSIDLFLEDDIHVGFEGYRRLAPRIAEIALSEVYEKSNHGRPIALESARLIASDSRRPMIRVKFSGVSGKLQSEGRPNGFEIRLPGPREDPGAHYPSPPSPDVPLYSIYRVDFDPDDPSAVILGLFDASPILLGHHHPLCGSINLVYSPGLNPYANIHDGRDIALPAFGPIAIAAPPCEVRPR
jgi:sialate O-acetylesterase